MQVTYRKVNETRLRPGEVADRDKPGTKVFMKLSSFVCEIISNLPR